MSFAKHVPPIISRKLNDVLWRRAPMTKRRRRGPRTSSRQQTNDDAAGHHSQRAPFQTAGVFR